jgi:hypothetical protein
MRCDKATIELLLCTKNGTCPIYGTAGASSTQSWEAPPARRVILEVCNFSFIKGGFVKLHECIFCVYSTWIMGMA